VPQVRTNSRTRSRVPFAKLLHLNYQLSNKRKDKAMNAKLVASCLVTAALIFPIAGHAADAASVASATKTLVKDSVITTKIKAKLAEKKLASLIHIKVETDDKGMVTLSGTAKSQKAVDRAVAIANAVKGVTSVDNQIIVEADK
jgi:hyperosmotically inducible protein